VRGGRARASQVRGCEATGKVRYRSQRDATMALRVFKADVRPGAYVPCRSYECDDCGGWHLTHLTVESYAVPVTLDTRTGLGLVLAASARANQEAPMNQTTAPSTFIEKVAALLAEEVDAFTAARALHLEPGRYCETCTVEVTVLAGDSEIVVRPFALVGSGAVCLGGDCQHDAAVAGWLHLCSESGCRDCGMGETPLEVGALL